MIHISISFILVLEILFIQVRNDPSVKRFRIGVIEIKVHALSSGKGKMFLCAACHAFTPVVNAWKY